MFTIIPAGDLAPFEAHLLALLVFTKALYRLMATTQERERDRSVSKQLQRTIRNQLVCSPTRRHSSLVLRSADILRCAPEILQECGSRAPSVSSLDLSYSIVDGETVSAFCARLKGLRVLRAENCGLQTFDPATPWPGRLREVDLSRNELTEFPEGFRRLMFLESLNLSGNKISLVDEATLRLPRLRSLHLLNNPVRNVPRAVCRDGVEEMRAYLKVEAAPLPVEEEEEVAAESRRISISLDTSLEKDIITCTAEETLTTRKRFLAANASASMEEGESIGRTDSLAGESGYDSPAATRRPSQSIDSDEPEEEGEEEEEEEEEVMMMMVGMEGDGVVEKEEEGEKGEEEGEEEEEGELPTFNSDLLPDSYTKSFSSELCSVYLPRECGAGAVVVSAREVRDHSFHPSPRRLSLEQQQQCPACELLITPVVEVSPHGLTFPPTGPAIIVLAHCGTPNVNRYCHLDCFFLSFFCCYML